VPTAQQPLNMDRPLLRLALTLQLRDLQTAPPEKVKAHPAAAIFPGAVPADAPRVTKTVQVDTKVPLWHSTGLYAAPGELVRVTAAGGAAGKGLGVRIGAHTDTLWHLDSWARAPEINARVLDREDDNGCGECLRRAHLHRRAGEVPAGHDRRRNRGRGRGAALRPRKTDPVTWRNEVRDRPAPWAEMECAEVILTVPSSVVAQDRQPRADHGVLGRGARLRCRARGLAGGARHAAEVLL